MYQIHNQIILQYDLTVSVSFEIFFPLLLDSWHGSKRCPCKHERTAAQSVL